MIRLTRRRPAGRTERCRRAGRGTGSRRCASARPGPRRPQRLGVGRVDQARRERPAGRGAWPWSAGPAPGAHAHLEQLDGPLDVAQPTAPELEVRLGVGARGSLSASMRALRVLISRTCRGVRPSAGHRSGSIARGTGRRGPGPRRWGAQQRLRLPGQGPPLVVGAVALQAAHERAVLASGRRSASRPSCGSGPWAPRSRRQLLDHLERLVLGDVLRHAPRGSCTKSTSASLP